MSASVWPDWVCVEGKGNQIRQINADISPFYICKVLKDLLLTSISGFPFQYQTKSRTPPKQRAKKRRAPDNFHIRPEDDFFSTKTTVLSSRPISTSLGAVVYSIIPCTTLHCLLFRNIDQLNTCAGCFVCVLCPVLCGETSLFVLSIVLEWTSARELVVFMLRQLLLQKGKLQWCHCVSGDSAAGSSSATWATERKEPGGKEKSQNF